MCASLSSRRPSFAIHVSQEQQAQFIESVKKSKLILKSDASFLPRSTNKGQKPIPIPRVTAKQGSRTNQLSPHSFEENEPEARQCELSLSYPQLYHPRSSLSQTFLTPLLHSSSHSSNHPIQANGSKESSLQKSDSVSVRLKHSISFTILQAHAGIHSSWKTGYYEGSPRKQRI